jgi:cytochrome c oxidase cbb3-type subunit 3
MSKPTRDVTLGHAHEADGIEEYDNPLPGWWLGILWVTVGFAIVYGADYHFVSHRSQVGEYEAEDAAFLAAHPSAAPSAVAGGAGAEIFGQYCAACHGASATGGIGPDLTDATWIHGGTLADITRTITEGVPEKGMVTWGPILGPEKISTVAAWIHDLGGGG